MAKSVFASNLAVYLATLGRRVLLLDADPEGSSAHSLLGAERPPSDAELAGTETPVPGLRLARAGFDDSPFPRPRTTVHSLGSAIRALPDVDQAVMDIGAGTQRARLDAWLDADEAIFLTTPEPTAVENTYRFLRAAFARHLQRCAHDTTTRRRLLEWRRRLGGAPAPLDLVRRLELAGDDLAYWVRDELERFSFRFAINQTRTRADLQLGDAMRTAVKRRLGLRATYLGYIDVDDMMWSCVRMRRPLLVESPGSKASKSIEKITRRLLTRGAPPRRRAAAVPPESHHDLLGVDRGATDEEIRRAYKRAREIYAPEALCGYGLFDAQDIEQIRARLEEAYDVLLDPARRRPYELSVFPEEKPSEPEPSQVAPGSMPPAPVITPDTEYTGSLLRAIRESQGADVREISRRTKIGTPYLHAIEDEDYRNLPRPGVRQRIRHSDGEVPQARRDPGEPLLCAAVSAFPRRRAGTVTAPLVLASKSPRRSNLLKQLAVRFEVDPAELEETRGLNEAPSAYVERMAREKAVGVARRQPGRYVLGSDTIVVLDDSVLTKPENDADAQGMLRRLSGRTHEVITAVAVAKDGSLLREAKVSTRVTFRSVGEGEIQRYVERGEGRDKAGGYAIQGLGAGFVQRIEGSYHAVVGLPAAETLSLLESVGAIAEWP